MPERAADGPSFAGNLDADGVLTIDGRLARFKHPKQMFVDALPGSALGKVRKDELRRMVNAHQQAITASSAERFG